MSNCLFEATLQKIESDCRCTPKNFIEVIENGFPPCTGAGKECMNKHMDDMGDDRDVEDEGERKACLAVCEDQQFDILVTQAGFPNSRTFRQKKEQFCVIFEKVGRACDGKQR